MCEVVEFYNEATDEWEELESVAALKTRFEVLPEDTAADMAEFGDDMCLCHTDIEAVVRRSGLPFRESICPGDLIVGPPELIHTKKSGPATHEWTTTRANPRGGVIEPSPRITLADHLAYVESVDASLARDVAAGERS